MQAGRLLYLSKDIFVSVKDAFPWSEEQEEI